MMRYGGADLDTIRQSPRSFGDVEVIEDMADRIMFLEAELEAVTTQRQEARLAVMNRESEIVRLSAELEKSNKYADHLGMSLRDVKKERDELVAALARCRDMVGHPDNLAYIDAALAKLGADKTGGGSCA